MPSRIKSFLQLLLSILLLLTAFDLSAENINVGGPGYTDGSGTVFIADQPYVAGGSGYITTDGGTASYSQDITGTTDDTLYQSLRGSSSLSYLFDGLAAGSYDVTLYFMEPYWTTSGQRLFDVSIEGVPVLTDFDIIAASGGQFAAWSQTFTADVLDGQLTVDFTGVLRLALVSGISFTAQNVVSEPDISVTPASIDFNETLVDSFTDMPLTVRNTGSQTLTISDLSTTNPNFTGTAPGVPFDIDAGSSQVITVRFSPAGSGAQTGDLLITSNDPDQGLLGVPLSGDGVVTIQRGMNVGGADYTGAGGTLFSADQPFVAGGSGYIITDGGIATYTDAVAGTADQALYQTLRGGSSFSYVFDGLAPGLYDVTLHFMEPFWSNAGDRLFDVAIEGTPVLTDFDIIAAAGSSFTAYVQTFSANVSDGQLNVDFTGVLRLALISGISVTLAQPDPDINSSAASIDFGPVVVGTTADATVTLINTGTQTLSISDLNLTDPAYTLVSPAVPFDIAAGGGTQDVTVRFSPTTESTLAASLEVTSNDPDENPYLVALTGTGVPLPPDDPDISLDITDLDFGLLLVDTTADGIVTVTNTGTQPLTVSDLTVTGASFSLLSAGPSVPFDIDSGNSQAIGVRFNPTATGLQAGSLLITSNDPDQGSAYVTLSGTGAVTVRSGLTVGGSTDYTDAMGTVHSADQPYVAGSYGYIATDGGIASYTQEITGTTEDALYQTLRGGSFFSYIFDNLAPGQYEVSLHFVEPYWSNVGDRLFNVAIEGTQVLTNFDIVLAAGGQFAAYSETFTVDVLDGQLNIDFTGVRRFALVSGITIAGLGVPPTQPVYSDVAADVGLVLAHDIGSVCVPPIGSGSAWADYDDDGDPDLFVTNRGGANHLYRNDGDTSGDGLPDFTDVAVALGVDDPSGAGHGAVFIDYDNDGDQDLYVTNWGGNTLYQNQLQETGTVAFVDVTGTAGIADSGRAITPSWADYDGDGNLDLYLGKHKECFDFNNNRDTLFHSNGDGTFTDVTGQLCADGVAPCAQVMGLGFAPGWFDFDDDGDLDLYLVNDNINSMFYTNVLWRNDGPDGSGGWLFTDISAVSGTDISLNGMGLGIGDYDNDGLLDIAFSNIGANWLMRNLGDGTFMDTSTNAGIQRATYANGERSVTWGTALFDYDNDGWLDLYYVSGEISLVSYPQPNVFFANNRDGTFTDISAASGLDDPRRGRSASLADFDGDGFVDVFVGNFGDAPGLYHNDGIAQGNSNHWLTVTVQGTVSNRDAIGTRLLLTTPDSVTLVREISSGPTHGGGDLRAAHFGLGDFTSAELSVRWPDGTVELIGTVSADQEIQLVE